MVWVGVWERIPWLAAVGGVTVDLDCSSAPSPGLADGRRSCEKGQAARHRLTAASITDGLCLVGLRCFLRGGKRQCCRFGFVVLFLSRSSPVLGTEPRARQASKHTTDCSPEGHCSDGPSEAIN